MNNIPSLIFKIIATLIVLFFIQSCTGQKSIEKAEAKVERLINKEFSKKNVHNSFVKVSSPTHSIDWNYVKGADKKDEKLTNETPFYTASIGKTFTATAIGILADQNKLNFDDKIQHYLSAEIMQGLHIFEGVDYSNDITIAHLLQHTSGLPDYFESPTTDGSPNGLEQLLSIPDKTWKPIETIELAKNQMEPLFIPGKGYHYTDTEYVLLGMIVEQLSEMPLHDFFIKMILEPLEMNHTYMHLRSQALTTSKPMADFYVADQNVSQFKSLSADWAGGGIVSTTSDLNTFLRALLKGNIVKNTTLEQMQQWVAEDKGMEYGFGLRKIKFKSLFPTLPDLHIIGHSGLNGSFMYYCPELDTYITGTLNQTDRAKASVALMVKTLAIIKTNLEHV